MVEVIDGDYFTTFFHINMVENVLVLGIPTLTALVIIKLIATVFAVNTPFGCLHS